MAALKTRFYLFGVLPLLLTVLLYIAARHQSLSGSGAAQRIKVVTPSSALNFSVTYLEALSFPRTCPGSSMVRPYGWLAILVP